MLREGELQFDEPLAARQRAGGGAVAFFLIPAFWVEHSGSLSLFVTPITYSCISGLVPTNQRMIATKL